MAGFDLSADRSRKKLDVAPVIFKKGKERKVLRPK